jgi:Dna[CI] antecedent, DciA
VTKDPRLVADILRTGALAKLGAEAERRRETTAMIRRHLATHLATDEADHLVSATIGDSGELVLVMDSPSWAARMRYRTAALPYERVIVKVLPRGGR